MDFTLKIYRSLLESVKAEHYSFFTFEDYCKKNALGKYVIVRHDVDLKAINSLRTAQIEAELGIRASYYFRVVPQSNQPDIIKAIAKLGHEIGYHYEDLSLFKGDAEKAISHFEKQLTHFRQFYPIQTICMHGSPTSKYDNRSIWKKYNYKDYDIIGEPYFDFLNKKDVLYLTDTGRCWDGEKFNVRDRRINTENINRPTIHSTMDFIHWIENSENQYPIMITTHPQRWTDKTLQWLKELFLQNTKNQIKKIIINHKK